MAKSPKSDSRQTEADSAGSIVAWTILAVVVSLVASRQWFTPILLSAPVARFLITKRPALNYAFSRSIFLRWSFTVLACYLVASAFVPDRVHTGVPFGADVVRIAEDGSGVWSLAWIAFAVIVFTAATYLGGGVLGYPVMATLLSTAAVSAASIYSLGRNIFESSIVAVSPWQWAVLAGCWILATPLAVLSPARMRWQTTIKKTDPTVVRRDLAVGFGLLVLALVLRLVLSHPYADLVRALSVT